MRKETGYKKHISKEEIEKLLHYMKSRKYRLIFRIMQYTGLRIGDVVGLKRDSFQPSSDEIRVLEQKTQKIVRKPINKRLRRYIFEFYRHERLDPENPYVFQPRTERQDKRHISTQQVRQSLVHARKMSGLTDVFYITQNGIKLHRISAHTFRHYFATQFYQLSGCDIVATKDAMDHTDFKTTSKHYIDTTSMSRKREISELIA